MENPSIGVPSWGDPLGQKEAEENGNKGGYEDVGHGESLSPRALPIQQWHQWG